MSKCSIPGCQSPAETYARFCTQHTREYPKGITHYPGCIDYHDGRPLMCELCPDSPILETGSFMIVGDGLPHRTWRCSKMVHSENMPEPPLTAVEKVAIVPVAVVWFVGKLIVTLGEIVYDNRYFLMWLAVMWALLLMRL